MHVEQFSSVNNLAVKYVHLTVVQVLYVYLTIVYGKNDGAHVRSMPKRSLFWQLGRHDHLGFYSVTTHEITISFARASESGRAWSRTTLVSSLNLEM